MDNKLYIFTNLFCVLTIFLVLFYPRMYMNINNGKIIKEILENDKIFKMKKDLMHNMNIIVSEFNDEKYLKKSFEKYLKNISQENKIKFLEENFIVKMVI